MTAPPIFDLLPTSCVNNEVINFNRQLKKRIAPFNNVKVLEIDLEREYFTNHGLHLNSSGKEYIAQKLARAISSFLKKEKASPVSLHWKDNTSLSDQNGNESHTSPPLNHIFPQVQRNHQEENHRTPLHLPASKMKMRPQMFTHNSPRDKETSQLHEAKIFYG